MARNSKFDVIADFLSPFEDNLELVLVGDNIPTREITKVAYGINQSRHHWFSLPDIKDKYTPANTTVLTTSELFHGKAEHIFRNKPSVLYLDKDMSYKTLMVITGRADRIDNVEVMLIRRYIIDIILNKVIFDISDMDSDLIEMLTSVMDGADEPYHYFISGNYMGVWLYFKKS